MSLVVPDSMKSAKRETGMSRCFITLVSINGVGVELRPLANDFWPIAPSYVDSKPSLNDMWLWSRVLVCCVVFMIVIVDGEFWLS